MRRAQNGALLGAALQYEQTMTVIDDYLSSLSGPEQMVAKHLVDIARQTVRGVSEEMYYAMPAFKYKGKGLLSIIANKDFMSLYPYCAVDSLGLDLSAFEHTSGSIHFRPDKPLPDVLVRDILAARLRQIDAR